MNEVNIEKHKHFIKRFSGGDYVIRDGMLERVEKKVASETDEQTRRVLYVGIE